MSTKIMEITTPLGDGVLLFYTMHGREELSRVSEFQLELLSEKKDINLDEILGKNVTVSLALQDDTQRHFNGYVTRFSQSGTLGRYHVYRATVSTWPWFLSRTADCRIFQDMTVPEIVKKVFADHPTAMFDDELTGSYRKWTYCVQYRETDLNFVCRLMEEEGIYFYFRHDQGKHTLVLSDSYSAHAPCQRAPVPFIAPEDLSRDDIEHLATWTLSREIQPGVYVQDDYDFEKPSVQLRTQKAVVRKYKPSDYEVYDYPGGYLQKKDGEALAAARIEELATQFETVQATGNVRTLAAGGLFTLEKNPREDQNREYLIVAATYDAEYGEYEALPEQSGADYRCGILAMPGKQQFRPRRITPKPFVQGPQTAVVVGPAGEEIHTDKYGRVKVLFHWDREGEKKKDENCSCWIRVSHPWAGKQWGAIAIPRIGQEVIVDFLEGDPDQPIITGRVYNAEQMPPYALPENMTQTGIKTRSSKGGTPENFNEIRFEDKKGEEQLFIHAEKNQDIEVENDETHWVGHDRTKTIDNDETTHVKHNRTETVGNDETISIEGNRTEAVKKDESITISGNRSRKVSKNDSLTVDGNRTATINSNESITVAKNQSVTVQGDQGTTVSKNQSINIGQNLTLKVSGNESISVSKNRQSDVTQNDSLKAGKNMLISAGDQITLQTGSASITMKKDGTIVIKGKDITLDGGGKINVKASKDLVMKGSKILQN